MTLAASVLSIVGAVLVYLAHPNQIVRSRRAPRALGWTGGLIGLAGLVLWMLENGAMVGLAVTVTLWMLALGLLPYLAAWRGAPAASARPGRHREPARRG